MLGETICWFWYALPYWFWKSVACDSCSPASSVSALPSFLAMAVYCWSAVIAAALSPFPS